MNVARETRSDNIANIIGPTAHALQELKPPLAQLSRKPWDKVRERQTKLDIVMVQKIHTRIIKVSFHSYRNGNSLRFSFSTSLFFYY